MQKKDINGNFVFIAGAIFSTHCW